MESVRFLDIGCGDAKATVDALKGARVAHYHGIDLSQAALDLASKALETLACPVTLDHRDFVAALRDRPQPVDVAWIGLSLHHLLAPAKLSLMREIRSVVGDHGLFRSTRTQAQRPRIATLGYFAGSTRTSLCGRH